MRAFAFFGLMVMGFSLSAGQGAQATATLPMVSVTANAFEFPKVDSINFRQVVTSECMVAGNTNCVDSDREWNEVVKVTLQEKAASRKTSSDNSTFDFTSTTPTTWSGAAHFNNISGMTLKLISQNLKAPLNRDEAIPATLKITEAAPDGAGAIVHNDMTGNCRLSMTLDQANCDFSVMTAKNERVPGTFIRIDVNFSKN